MSSQDRRSGTMELLRKPSGSLEAAFFKGQIAFKDLPVKVVQEDGMEMIVLHGEYTREVSETFMKCFDYERHWRGRLEDL